MEFSPTSYHHRDRFFGRSDDLAEVEEALRHDRACSIGIHGPPGVGKSRFVAELARRWSQSGDPVAFVDGRAAVDAPSFFDTLATALGLPPITEFDAQAVSAQICDALTERTDLLLVLDDIESIRDEITTVLGPVLQRERSTRILMTSRAALDIASLRPMALKPLSSATAAELFAHRAKRARPGFEAAQLAPGELEALVHRLDHLPLAIELAAARLTILTPQALLDRLDQRFQILRPGHSTTPSAPMALDNAIRISWEMLDDVQRTTLSQCAVFHGGFTLEAAEAVVRPGNEECWVGDILQSLVLQSLVSTSEGGEFRFHLLESIGDYAQKYGESSQIEDARNRQAQFYFERAKSWSNKVSGTDGKPALMHLCEEISNIIAAAEFLSSTKPEKALELLLCLEPTFEVRGLLGAYLERIDACRDAVVGEDSVHTALTRARILHSGGRLREALDAIDHAHEALAENSTPRDPSLGEILLCRGQILRDLGRLDEAYADWKQAISATDEPFWLFQIHNELGLMALNRARFGARESSDLDDDLSELKRGADLLRQAYKLANEHTHALYRVRPAVGWALALHETGESDRALRLLRDELQVQIAENYRNGVLLCERHMAILEFYSGHYDRALELADQVDRGLVMAGLTARRARNLSYRAIFANAAGRIDDAAEFIAQALDASERTGQEITALITDVQGLMIAWEQGDDRAAQAHLERARAAAESVGSPGHASFLNAYESFYLARDGRREEARNLCDEAIRNLSDAAEYQRPVDDPRWKTVARAWRAILELCDASNAVDDGDWDRIYDALDAAEEVQQGSEDPLTAVARRHVRLIAERVRRDHGLSEQRPAHILRITDDGRGFRLDGEDPVDLSNRDPLRRILASLAERSKSGEPSADLEAVVAAGWPGENLEAQSAANRVYATIRMLRNMGLKDILITDDGGYRLASDVLVI